MAPEARRSPLPDAQQTAWTGHHHPRRAGPRHRVPLFRWRRVALAGAGRSARQGQRRAAVVLQRSGMGRAGQRGRQRPGQDLSRAGRHGSRRGVLESLREGSTAMANGCTRNAFRCCAPAGRTHGSKSCSTRAATARSGACSPPSVSASSACCASRSAVSNWATCPRANGANSVQQKWPHWVAVIRCHFRRALRRGRCLTWHALARYLSTELLKVARGTAGRACDMSTTTRHR